MLWSDCFVLSFAFREVGTIPVTGEKTVRLAPPLAKEIAALAIKTVSVRECVKIMNWLIGELKRQGVD